MATRHEPVLLEEVLGQLRPEAGRSYLDLTLGGGGYSAALLEGGARVVALDRDPGAVAAAQSRLRSHGERFSAYQHDFGSFGQLLDDAGLKAVDGICMDLGLSSDQLDDPGRGFGFRHDGPLDLRFDRANGRPASALLKDASPGAIQDLLSRFGEVRRAGRIARMLAARAAELAELQTQDVREIVGQCVPKGAKPEPELARVFQALRIAVNDELAQLESALAAIPDRLNPGGRAAIVSYHSLEDRRVKDFFRQEAGMSGGGTRHLPPATSVRAAARLRILTRRPIRPTQAEIDRNPRARSARLRVAERLS
ncbi:MAG TPA: 16S rRNA (cytosine(1402)-N(4))-methyltransferase RsmH [Candidatus Krumholzibacteria bacterium]